MKRLVWIAMLLLVVGGSSTAFAQYDPKAKAILDKVSENYRSVDAFKAHYTRSIESPSGEVYASMDGEIVVQGPKFNLKMEDQEIISDGKVVWAYMRDANEVNISNYEPTEDEITPTKIYTLYENGYKYALMSELKDKNGDIIQTIDMEPEDRRSEVAKIRLMVNKKDSTVRKWIVFERGTNNRQIFEINKYDPNINVTNDTFTFNKSSHPGVNEVDLR